MTREDRMNGQMTKEVCWVMQIDERKLYDELGEDLDIEFRDK